MSTDNTMNQDANAFATNFGIPGVDQAIGLARAGVQLGLGLASMAIEEMQRVGAEAMRRGAVVERAGVERATEIERDAVDNMKSYLRRSKEKANEISIEAKVEQALATFDVPTREDIRELHLHLAAVSEKINQLQHQQ